MPRKMNLSALRSKFAKEINSAICVYDATAGMNRFWRCWVARMTVVEIHGAWERYVENRLVAALNHNPKHFLQQQNIAGVTRVSPGFARYIIRGGRRFFDFRSMGDLTEKANRWLGKSLNPFSSITAKDRSFIDCVAAIRNHVVHGSEASVAAYKQSLRSVWGIKAAPTPDEFLNAKDWWTPSPARYKSRLHVLAEVIERTIKNT